MMVVGNLKPRKSNAGRKPVADKKLLIRLFIPESVIEANGGMDKVREICTELLTTRAIN